jgi:hypothetical protein
MRAIDLQEDKQIEVREFLQKTQGTAEKQTQFDEFFE